VSSESEERKRVITELVRIDAAIAKADATMEAQPENHPQWRDALEEKADLLKRRHTLDFLTGRGRSSNIY
jgi:hypothetical protein